MLALRLSNKCGYCQSIRGQVTPVPHIYYIFPKQVDNDESPFLMFLKTAGNCIVKVMVFIKGKEKNAYDCTIVPRYLNLPRHIKEALQVVLIQFLTLT